jgi:hypothetical protein
MFFNLVKHIIRSLKLKIARNKCEGRAIFFKLKFVIFQDVV